MVGTKEFTLNFDNVYKDEIDHKFLVTFEKNNSAVDISGATSTKQLIFEKPDGTFLTKDGTFETDGTDGKLYYKSISGDLDTAGSWKIQGKVVIGGETKWSSTGAFEVYPTLG